MTDSSFVIPFFFYSILLRNPTKHRDHSVQGLGMKKICFPRMKTCHHLPLQRVTGTERQENEKDSAIFGEAFDKAFILTATHLSCRGLHKQSCHTSRRLPSPH